MLPKYPPHMNTSIIHSLFASRVTIYFVFSPDLILDQKQFHAHQWPAAYSPGHSLYHHKVSNSSTPNGFLPNGEHTPSKYKYYDIHPWITPLSNTSITRYTSLEHIPIEDKYYKIHIPRAQPLVSESIIR